MKRRHRIVAGLSAALLIAGCGSKTDSEPAPTTPTAPVAAAPKKVIFFLGDGMGMTTMTAARIYAVGEDGELTMDTLPETAFVKTFSNDAQVTDSAPSMAAYMTGVKMNNEVISMTPDTVAKSPNTDGTGNCGTGNGKAVTTLLEMAKAQGLSTGVVTTTRVTHATPAATYAHVCHRDAESDIAAALVPGGAGFNTALADGLEVILGGGSQYFTTTAKGGKRSDNRDLTAEMQARNYAYVTDADGFNKIDASKTDRLLGLFSSGHMSYDLDRDPRKEPSLAEMTGKAMDVLGKNGKGYFLMVEGGRIDHGLHETSAKKALHDTVAFDNAIKAAIAKAKVTDPALKNTLIVVTADHDHTLVLNGYAKLTGKTTATNPGILGFVRDYVSGALTLDNDKLPYTILGFGNGENRVSGKRGLLSEDQAAANTYHQEAVIRTTPGNETHGGTDVFLGAIGKNADSFSGTIDNTKVFNLVKTAAGL